MNLGMPPNVHGKIVILVLADEQIRYNRQDHGRHDEQRQRPRKQPSKGERKPSTAIPIKVDTLGGLAVLDQTIITICTIAIKDCPSNLGEPLCRCQRGRQHVPNAADRGVARIVVLGVVARARLIKGNIQPSLSECRSEYLEISAALDHSSLKGVCRNNGAKRMGALGIGLGSLKIGGSEEHRSASSAGSFQVDKRVAKLEKRAIAKGASAEEAILFRIVEEEDDAMLRLVALGGEVAEQLQQTYARHAIISRTITRRDTENTLANS